MTSRKPLPKGPNPVEPVVGCGYSIYMSRRDIGSGVRFFIASRVTRSYITLFYPPKLKSLRLSRAEWNELIVVKEVAYDRKLLRQNIARIVEQHERLGMRYAPSASKAVLRLLRGKC